jgi:uncharacterized protein (DUF488 family)
MSNRLYTIGHSNHDIDKFIALLKQHGVTALADVRSTPYSRYMPHFCQKPLKAALNKAGISYVFLGQELGARPDDQSCYVNGKALYERIAATEAFSSGIDRVMKGTRKFDIALMCAEKDPVTCHRAILVCQHLREQPLTINHILSNGELESHQHLEERMLTIHGLVKSPVNTAESPEAAQLSLFGMSEQPVPGTNTALLETESQEDTLRQAYRLQGEQIAYVEKSHGSNT